MVEGAKGLYHLMGGIAQLGLVGICWLSLILGSSSAYAQQSGNMDFRSFCTAVDSKSFENNPTRDGVLYQYQTMVYDAAGVLPNDSSEVAFQKSKAFMDANAASLVCNLINFNPRSGSILKLAVARQSNEFIWDAVVNWKLDLNQIDATDGKTVLDYITDRRASAGPTFARTLDRYYKRFRDGGARHAHELPAKALAR
jgi:hypothetical protein